MLAIRWSQEIVVEKSCIIYGAVATMLINAVKSPHSLLVQLQHTPPLCQARRRRRLRRRPLLPLPLPLALRTSMAHHDMIVERALSGREEQASLCVKGHAGSRAHA